MITELVTLPAQYPVSLTEGKKQCEIDEPETAHDTYVKSLIMAATGRAEQYLHRRLVSQTWKLYLDCWPASGSIVLPFGRLQSVTSIKYTDSDGDETTWDADEYIVNTNSEPGLVTLGYGESFPTATLYPSNPIKIEFVCGYFIGDIWAISTGYSEDKLIVPIAENGLVYQAGGDGTSDSSAPAWPLTIGGTVVDNDITWTCIGLAVPEAIRHAIKLDISDFFENRETEVYIPNHFTLKTWEALLFPYKLWGGVF